MRRTEAMSATELKPSDDEIAELYRRLQRTRKTRAEACQAFRELFRPAEDAVVEQIAQRLESRAESQQPLSGSVAKRAIFTELHAVARDIRSGAWQGGK
jgi:hypothetical protein